MSFILSSKGYLLPDLLRTPFIVEFNLESCQASFRGSWLIKTTLYPFWFRYLITSCHPLGCNQYLA
jgi:hypothetical protein